MLGEVCFPDSWRFEAWRPFWGSVASEISMSGFIFSPGDPLVAELCSMFVCWPGADFLGRNFSDDKLYFESGVSIFLAFSGLESFLGTCGFRNQYVCFHFRLLGPLGGRVMFDFFFGPGTIFWSDTFGPGWTHLVEVFYWGPNFLWGIDFYWGSTPQ